MKCIFPLLIVGVQLPACRFCVGEGSHQRFVGEAMDKTVQQSADIQVPAADPAIDHALEQLDHTLAAWTRVLGDAQAHLRQLLPAANLSQPAPTKPIPAEPARTPASNPEPPEIDRPSPTSVGDSRGDGLTEEDQALLATLDPQVAQTISIMRRLTPVKRSVREVLQEYESTHTAPQADRPVKQSWFARRK